MGDRNVFYSLVVNKYFIANTCQTPSPSSGVHQQTKMVRNKIDSIFIRKEFRKKVYLFNENGNIDINGDYNLVVIDIKLHRFTKFKPVAQPIGMIYDYSTILY